MAQPGSSNPAPVDALTAELPDLDWPPVVDWNTFVQTLWLVIDYGASLHPRRALEIRLWGRSWVSHHARAAWDKQSPDRHPRTLERLRWLSLFMWRLPEGDFKAHLPAWQSVFQWTGAIKQDAWACILQRRAAQAAALPPTTAVQAASPRHASPTPPAPPTRRTFILPPRHEPTPDEQAAGATGVIALPDGTRHLYRGVPLGTSLFGSSWQRPVPPQYRPAPRNPGFL
ncbi:hypothetical protein JCM9279_007197 [Rhodotorula babjevae]